MDSVVSKELVEREIMTNYIQVSALIQDINQVNGPMERLNDMNSLGREKLAHLRKYIEQFEQIARETVDSSRQKILQEAEIYRQQYTRCLGSFKTANTSAMLRIEKAYRAELMNSTDKDGSSELGVRYRKDKAGIVKMSSNVTDQLLSISRNLADTTQRSAETLETLANSSTTVHSTKDELLTTSNVIQQSGTLIAKYGRRELTDKVLLFFAFAFFFACVLYIVHKRLF